MVKFVEYFRWKLIVSVAAKVVQVLTIMISISVSDLEIKSVHSITISTFILPLTPPKSREV